MKVISTVVPFEFPMHLFASTSPTQHFSLPPQAFQYEMQQQQQQQQEHAAMLTQNNIFRDSFDQHGDGSLSDHPLLGLGVGRADHDLGPPI